MSDPNETNETIVPVDIALQLPPPDLLRQVLPTTIIELPAGRQLIRAAWNAPSLWPAMVQRTYRFGPPAGLVEDAGFPWFWIYAADSVLTALWEAQFCVNLATAPGRFAIERGADNGLIARLTFATPLRLLDLSGTAASKLGIYDQLRSPDYAWCQWFGWQLDQFIAEHHEEIHGFVYPSRRHPGTNAYAISSRVQSALAPDVRHQRFAEMDEYGLLLSDHCYIDRRLL